MPGKQKIQGFYPDYGRRFFMKSGLVLIAFLLYTGLGFSLSEPEYWVRIDSLTAARDWKAAETILNKALKDYPDHEGFYTSLAWVYREKEEYDLADSLVLKAETLFPTSPAIKKARVWNQVSRAWFILGQGKLAEATVFANKAYTAMPDDEWVLNLYLHVTIQSGGALNVLKLTEEAVLQFPQNKFLRGKYTWALTSAANIKKDQGDTNTYIGFSEKAYQLTPDEDWVINHYGVSRVVLKDFQKAESVFLSAIKRYPAYPWFYTNLIWSYWEDATEKQRNNDWAGAVTTYRKLRDVSADPYNPEASLIWALNTMASRGLDISGEIQQEKPVLLKLLYGIDTEKELETIIEPVGLLVRWTRDRKLYEKARSVLMAKFPDNDRLLIWSGSLLSTLDLISGVSYKTSLNEYMPLLRRGMELYEKKHPGRKAVRGLLFPLKGRAYVVSQNNDPEAATHNGYLKYAYDFAIVNKDGRFLKPGTTGEKTEDALIFGWPLLSCVDGVIESAVDSNQDLKAGELPKLYGNVVEIRMADGNLLHYDHIKQGSVRVKKGDRVKRGDVIAEGGNSGYSLGPHLHICVFDTNYVTLPMYFDGIEPSDGDFKKGDILTTGE